MISKMQRRGQIVGVPSKSIWRRRIAKVGRTREGRYPQGHYRVGDPQFGKRSLYTCDCLPPYSYLIEIWVLRPFVCRTPRSFVLTKGKFQNLHTNILSRIPILSASCITMTLIPRTMKTALRSIQIAFEYTVLKYFLIYRCRFTNDWVSSQLESTAGAAGKNDYWTTLSLYLTSMANSHFPWVVPHFL